MKIIGIPVWKVTTGALGVTMPYIKFIENFGAARLIMPWEKDTFNPNEYDLIVLPGGPDVNPARYGQLPGAYTGNSCIYREAFDEHFLPKIIDAKRPIVGICRGLI